MQRWEYKRIGTGGELSERDLNVMGNNGWELVNIIFTMQTPTYSLRPTYENQFAPYPAHPVSTEHFVYIFIRPNT